MEQYKKFLVPFDSTKLNLFICNDTFKKKEKKASDDEEGPNNLESSSDNFSCPFLIIRR